jgi:hypothetical protein
LAIVALALEEIRLRGQVVDNVSRLAHERRLLGRHGPTSANRANICSRLSKAGATRLAEKPIRTASLDGRLRTPTRIETWSLPANLAVLRFAAQREATAALGLAFRGLPNAAGLLFPNAATIFGSALSTPAHSTAQIEHGRVKLVEFVGRKIATQLWPCQRAAFQRSKQ